MMPSDFRKMAAMILIGLTPSVLASEWRVETTNLKITEPSSLAGQYDSAMGDFGIPLYGASMVGELKYVASNGNGCNAFHKEFESDLATYVALVERGGCYFVEKAYHAQQAGAKAILVYDDRSESLLTMAAPEDQPEIAKLRDNIEIPTALIQQSLGQKLKDVLTSSKDPVMVQMDWSEAMAHPDERVEWEFWTSSNDGCGNSCDIQLRFKKEFRDTAGQLEKDKFTLFRPHYMMRPCTGPEDSEDCANNCLHHGRYCAMDSVGSGYQGSFKGRQSCALLKHTALSRSGKSSVLVRVSMQIVEENKRQLCVFQEANSTGKPWLWWDFVGGYGTRCTFANNKFNDEACAKAEVEAIGLSNDKILQCMGDSRADGQHPLLQADLDDRQISAWGAKILLLPSIIINTNQYRGRIDPASVLRGLCSGFSESTEPQICLSGALQVDECAADTHDCWRGSGKSACVDTFRGYVCECPRGYNGDGHKCRDVDECAEGLAHCDQLCLNEPGGFRCACESGYQLLGSKTIAICSPIDYCRGDNGGCEQSCESKNGTKTCSCGVGLQLHKDGLECEDIDECTTGTAKCQQKCSNKDPRVDGVPYVCDCEEGYAVSPIHNEECLADSQYLQMLGLSAWAGATNLSYASIASIVIGSALVVVLAGYGIYRWRIRNAMHSEIQAIMRQYMPLDGNNFPPDNTQDGRELRSVKSTIKASLSPADEQC